MHKFPKKTSTDLVAHFQKRCIQRIGVILSQRVLKALLERKKLIFVKAESNTRTVFRLYKEDYNGSSMLQFDVALVYNKPLHTFVTVLPWKHCKWNPDNKNKPKYWWLSKI